MLIKEQEYGLTSTFKPVFFHWSSALLQIPHERHTGYCQAWIDYREGMVRNSLP